MSEYTKGPWSVTDGLNSGCYIKALENKAKKKQKVAAVGGPDREANAALFVGSMFL